MKTLMNGLKTKIENTVKSLWKDESAQGMTEYILLVVVVLAIALIFKDKIKEAVTNKLNEVQSGLGGFQG